MDILSVINTISLNACTIDATTIEKYAWYPKNWRCKVLRIYFTLKISNDWNEVFMFKDISMTVIKTNIIIILIKRKVTESRKKTKQLMKDPWRESMSVRIFSADESWKEREILDSSWLITVSLIFKYSEIGILKLQIKICINMTFNRTGAFPQIETKHFTC